MAAMIAYYDFDEEILKENNYSATLRELLESDKSVYDKLQKELEHAPNSAKQYKAEQALALYEEIIKEESEYGDWVIKAVKDDNNKSGFYGCLIETAPDEAIIGFRGSETDDAEDFINDWVKADAGAFFLDETPQQQMAEEFMQEINDQYNYDRYYTSGHSLGGHLSNHAVITAPNDMKDKIQQSYSFDGLGFSDKYLKIHQKDIEQSQGKLIHYQWGWAGGTLNQPEGAKNQVIKIKDTQDVEIDVWTRHRFELLEFDENGMVIKGEVDEYSKRVFELINSLDSGKNKLVDWMEDIVNVDGIEKFLDDSGLNVFYDQILYGISAPMKGGFGNSKGFSIYIFDMKNRISDMQQYVGILEDADFELNRICKNLTNISMKNIKKRLQTIQIELNVIVKRMNSFQKSGMNIVKYYENSENKIINTMIF